MKLHWEEVQKLAEAHSIEEPSSNRSSFERFLRFWWCQKYNRPFKDPLLDQYTLDELCYEFLRYFYADPENDPSKLKEEKRAREDEDSWIKAQMAELAKQNAKLGGVIQQISESATKAQAKPHEAQKEPAKLDLPEFSTKFDE